jgi:hypothetical protein
LVGTINPKNKLLGFIEEGFESLPLKTFDKTTIKIRRHNNEA